MKKSQLIKFKISLFINSLTLISLFGCSNKSKEVHTYSDAEGESFEIGSSARVTPACMYGGTSSASNSCRSSLTNNSKEKKDPEKTGASQPTLADKDPFPFTVAIQLSSDFICSGVLIAPQVVLTAAHCLVKLDDPKKELTNGLISDGYVYIGQGKTLKSIDLKDTNRDFLKVNGVEGMRIKIDKVIHHPLYKDSSDYDFGLIILKEAVTDSNKIYPLFENQNSELGANEIKSDSLFSVQGFGLNKQLSPFINYRYIPELNVDYDGGLRIKMAITLEYNSKENKTLILKGLGKDICPGDSGGPVFLRLENEDPKDWPLLGVSSQSLAGCGAFGKNVIYTSRYAMIKDELNWILDQIQFLD